MTTTVVQTVPEPESQTESGCAMHDHGLTERAFERGVERDA